MRLHALLLACACLACLACHPTSHGGTGPAGAGTGKPVPADTTFPASADCPTLCGHLGGCEVAAARLATCPADCKARADEATAALFECLASARSCEEMQECFAVGEPD